MGYIGKSLGSITTEARTVDTMVGDGVISTLALSKTPGSVNNVEVFYDGVFQTPGEDFTLSDNTLTFTTPPPNTVNVVVLSGNDSRVVYPDNNSITTKKILDGTITSSKFNDIAVEKVSGTLSAVDGSAVTGINSPDVVDVTTAASDPTRTTNKPVGSLAVNSTSGEMFICTDAETDNNTWMNVGLGNADVPPAPTFQGTVAGFIPSGANVSSIEKLSFSAGVNSVATLHGDLSVWQQHGAGMSSLTHGYDAGGYSVAAHSSTIQKFSFTSNVTAANAGNLSTGVYYNDGCTDVSGQTGYSCAGSDAIGPTINSERIESFSFSSNSVNSGFGNLVARNLGSTHSSTTYGFCAAGFWGTAASPNTYSTIDKFSFASGGAVSGHGNLFGGHKTLAGGASSATEGFQFGGQHFSTVVLVEKFSFASNSTGSLWGDLFVNAAGNTCAVSGENFAYVQHGGGTIVSKFVYANNAVSVDWMDLVAARATGGTSQY